MSGLEGDHLFCILSNPLKQQPQFQNADSLCRFSMPILYADFLSIGFCLAILNRWCNVSEAGTYPRL